MNEVSYAVVSLGYILYGIDKALVYVQSASLFSNYMKLLASQKIRYSPIPSAHRHDLQSYVDNINKEMGFNTEFDRLTPDLLVENKYQCAYEKGLLNQSIGKLSQHSLHPQTEYVHHESHLSRLFADTTIEITSCILVTPTTMQVTYKKKESCLKVNRRSQIVINSQVTSYLRQVLDKALRTLERHGNKLLYVGKSKI